MSDTAKLALVASRGDGLPAATVPLSKFATVSRERTQFKRANEQLRKDNARLRQMMIAMLKARVGVLGNSEDFLCRALAADDVEFGTTFAELCRVFGERG